VCSLFFEDPDTKDFFTLTMQANEEDTLAKDQAKFTEDL